MKERKKERRKKNEREFFLPFSFLILSFKKQILFLPKFCLERLFGMYYSTHLQQYVKFTIILNIRWTLNLIAILCTDRRWYNTTVLVQQQQQFAVFVCVSWCSCVFGFNGGSVTEHRARRTHTTAAAAAVCSFCVCQLVRSCVRL